MGTAGAACSYVLFALSASPKLAPGTALIILVASRVLAGVFSNIAVASAYIADITTAENRSKGWG